MPKKFEIRPFEKNVAGRKDFRCGNPKLDTYFHSQVSQDIRRNYARCFVLHECESGKIAGFYTLSSMSLPLERLPILLRKKLPNYSNVPAALIGWLARDLSFKGQNVGELLLIDAFKEIVKAADSIGISVIFVDAIDQKAADFYKSFDFTPAVDDPLTLFLRIETVRATIADIK